MRDGKVIGNGNLGKAKRMIMFEGWTLEKGEDDLFYKD